MVEKLPTIVQLEAWLPRPIARSLKNFRDIPQSSSAFEKIDALTKVSEVAIKLLAAICSKAYLLDGGRDSSFQEAIDRLGKMSLGQWAGLLRLSLAPYERRVREIPIDQIYDSYFFSWGSSEDISVSVACLSEGSQGEVKRPGGKLTTAALLDVLVAFRNFVAHGAKLSNDEWEVLLPSVELLVKYVLNSFQFFKEFNLFSVEEVKVEKNDSNNQFVHEGWIILGPQVERVRLLGTDALHDKRLYLVRHDQESILDFAIDLSPFWIFQSCPECYRPASFVLNSIKGKRINYLSYQCGHRLELQDIGAEITDIKAFLEGKVSIDVLFSGKVIGRSAESLAMGPTPEERKQVKALVSEARDNFELGFYYEAIPLLDQALIIDQDDSTVHYLRAFAKLLANQGLEGVNAELEKTVKLNPDFHEAFYVLGQIHLSLNAVIKAKEYIDSAMRNDPTNELYREFDSNVSQLSLEVSEERISFDLEKKDREILNITIAENLKLGKTSRIKLQNWTAGIPPFSWISKAPLRRSAIISGSLFVIVLLLQGTAISRQIITEQATIALNNWLLMYVSFLGVDFVVMLYGRLRAVFPIPRESFKRFFIRQCSLMFGKSCFVEEGAKSKGTIDTIRTDWLFALIAGAGFLVLLPLQYLCADDPFEFNRATIARHFAYVFQAFVFCWVFPLSLLCLRFAPGFQRLPQRYFLEMPDSVSLRALADVYVGFAMLAALLVPGFLIQHYVFNTIEVAPFAHWSYFIVASALLICVFGVSQLIVKFTLENLRDKTLTRFSFEVETTFEEFMRRPGEQSFARMEKFRDYMIELSKIGTKSLSRRGKRGLFASTLLVGVSTAIYTWAVWDKLWFV